MAAFNELSLLEKGKFLTAEVPKGRKRGMRVRAGRMAAEKTKIGRYRSKLKVAIERGET